MSSLIKVTLRGGPRDGETFLVGRELFNHGELQIIDHKSSFEWVSRRPMSLAKHKIVIYKRPKYGDQNVWSCSTK